MGPLEHMEKSQTIVSSKVSRISMGIVEKPQFVNSHRDSEGLSY